jgi:hypothetical protein
MKRVAAVQSSDGAFPDPLPKTSHNQYSDDEYPEAISRMGS